MGECLTDERGGKYEERKERLTGFLTINGKVDYNENNALCAKS